MKKAYEFCTCKDTSCPLHPTNHEYGCDLCILKNLKKREIPSCFFNMVDSEAKLDDYYFEDFAKLVLDK